MGGSSLGQQRLSSAQNLRMVRAVFGVRAPKGVPHLRVARLRARSSASSGIGGGSNPPGGSGGGHGWDGSSPSDDGGSSSKAALLLAGKAALDGLPAEIVAAIKSGHISHEVLTRYLDMSKSAFIAWLMKYPYVEDVHSFLW